MTPRLKANKSLEYSDLITILTDIFVALEHANAERIPKTVSELKELKERLSSNDAPWILAYLQLVDHAIGTLEHKYEFGGYREVMEIYDSDDLHSSYGIEMDEEE